VVEERALIASAIEAKKVVIGISSGAQLVASTLGGRVKKAPYEEIGFFPIDFTKEARNVFPFLPNQLTAMHGHVDTFDVPLGAVSLATSAACPHQAFLARNRILCLQFHLEWDEDHSHEALEALADTITRGPYVQSVSTILKAKEIYCPEMKQVLFQLLDAMVEQCKVPCPEDIEEEEEEKDE
jgi:GMP synthase (glutamine-hydrolysing)